MSAPCLPPTLRWRRRRSVSRSTATAASTRRRSTAGASSRTKTALRVRLVSRNGRDHTQRFAGIACAIANYFCIAYEIAQNSSQHARALSSSTARFGESLRSRGTRPSTTRQISGNRSFGTPWAGAGVAGVRDSRAGERDREWLPLLTPEAVSSTASRGAHSHGEPP
jgi:hypothetical protein